jgi:hypothetical protein
MVFSGIAVAFVRHSGETRALFFLNLDIMAHAFVFP